MGTHIITVVLAHFGRGEFIAALVSLLSLLDVEGFLAQLLGLVGTPHPLKLRSQLLPGGDVEHTGVEVLIFQVMGLEGQEVYAGRGQGGESGAVGELLGCQAQVGDVGEPGRGTDVLGDRLLEEGEGHVYQLLLVEAQGGFVEALLGIGQQQALEQGVERGGRHGVRVMGGPVEAAGGGPGGTAWNGDGPSHPGVVRRETTAPGGAERLA